ncbi:CBO0543 family protein [Neobacillus bataviensis]|uniref:CBO0543 family protein n=1 Tax=Neobacillus bataviensis TaxID=220685 RepID=UPI001CC0F6C6|nr:CBO0543 family protein [Neobacillus bataviensis]
MNTVKHLNGSSLQPLRKKRLTLWNKHYLASAVLASLFGSYLDLYFVGKGIYHFPHRPLPEIFSINIAFTLAGLPILIMVVLHCLSQVNNWGKAGIILFVSLLMPILEKLAEELGWFVHADEWKHGYTFVGYLVFLTIIYSCFRWMEKHK